MSGTCVLTDHILKFAEGIIVYLRFFPENIKHNLELMGGLNMDEVVMIELVKRGMGRQEAHEIVRTIRWRAASRTCI